MYIFSVTFTYISVTFGSVVCILILMNMITGGCFLEVMQPGHEADHSPPSSSVLRLRMFGTVPPFPHTLSWHGAYRETTSHLAYVPNGIKSISGMFKDFNARLAYPITFKCNSPFYRIRDIYGITHTHTHNELD
jgi:hypothetical protein